MREDPGGLHDRRIVVQRLALTLKDGAGNRAGRFVADGQELGHDLPRLEVTRQAHPARRAEVARHGAAGLTGEANRKAARHLERDSHRFGQRTVRQANKVLDEAIRRIGGSFDDRQRVPLDEAVDGHLYTVWNRPGGRISLPSVRDGVGHDPSRLALAYVHTVRPEMRYQVLGQHAEEMHEVDRNR